MVRVGFSAPPVVNTLPSLTNRFFTFVRLSPLVHHTVRGIGAHAVGAEVVGGG